MCVPSAYHRTRPAKCACPVPAAMPDEMCVPSTTGVALRPTKCALPTDPAGQAENCAPC